MIASACNPTNASNPPLDFEQSHYFQMETGMVYAADSDTLVLGYNDQRGLYKWNQSNDTLEDLPFDCPSTGTVCHRQSIAGYSISFDRGQSWTYKGVIRSAPPNCGQSVCPRLLRGDPGLATNGKRVLYANIAYSTEDDIYTATVVDNANIDTLAIARSEDGGQNFGVAFAATFVPGLYANGSVSVDQPTADMVTDTAAVAFDDGNRGDLHIVWNATSGNDSAWIDQDITATDQVATGGANGLTGGRAVIQLASPTNGYLAWMPTDNLAYTQPALHGTVNYVVAVASIRLISGQWYATKIFQSPSITVESEGMSVDSAGNTRPWHDIKPMDMRIGAIQHGTTGGVSGATIHLVYRSQNFKTGESIITYWNCTDSGSNCSWNGSNNSAGWIKRDIIPQTLVVDATKRPPRITVQTYGGNAYQPTVIADRESSGTVGITWYQQVGKNSLTYTALGEYGNGTVALELSPFFGPCATHGIDTYIGDHVYGDYIASAIVPAPVFFPNFMAIVSAHSDSPFCQFKNQLTYETHVETERW